MLEKANAEGYMVRFRTKIQDVYVFDVFDKEKCQDSYLGQVFFCTKSNNIVWFARDIESKSKKKIEKKLKELIIFIKN